MNVLVVCHYGLYLDLTFSFVHNQVKAYAALGHKVRVIVPVPIGKVQKQGVGKTPFMKELDTDGVEIYYLRYISLSNFGEQHFNTPSAISMISLHLPRILRGFKPDILHAHTLGFDSEIGAWLKRKLHCPLVVTTHGSDTFLPFRRGRLAQIKKATDVADVVVAVSSLLKKRLAEAGATVKTVVILNGFNVEYAECKSDRGRVSLLQVGHLIDRKKVDVTIRAFQQIKEQNPEAVLSVIGSGCDRAALKALSEQLGLSDSVRFVGEIPNHEVLETMSKSRFFVMPSVGEGFGIVYLEAMACGCVTIGTEGEGIADLIVSGHNGFLVPPDDPEAITRVVEWCLQHPEETAGITERGRQAVQELTWEQNAVKYTELFEELLKDHAN